MNVCIVVPDKWTKSDIKSSGQRLDKIFQSVIKQTFPIDYLVVWHSDVNLSPMGLERMLKRFRDPRVGVVGIRDPMTWRKGVTRERPERFNPLETGEDVQGVCRVYAYRASALKGAPFHSQPGTAPGTPDLPHSGSAGHRKTSRHTGTQPDRYHCLKSDQEYRAA